MRRFLLGLLLIAGTVPFDVACSKDDETGDGDLGDGDGDEIDPGLGGDGGDGDGDAPSCPSFVGLDNCEEQGQAAKKVEANLLLVIDKSGSMDDEGGFSTTKWQVMRQALNAALNEAKYDINVGLELYPRTGNPLMEIAPGDGCGPAGNCCTMPTVKEPNIAVGPGIDTVPLILEEFANVRPGGGTPTSVALEHAYEYFVNGDGKDLEGDKFVVLATDGGPNCNSGISCDVSSCTLNIEERTLTSGTVCESDGNNCCLGSGEGCVDDAATVDAVQTLATAGITTFVIGVPGSEFYADLLDEVAEEGGRPQEGDRKYFQVDGADGVDALTDVFRAITQELVTSCEIPLSEDPKSLIDVNVAVDCEIVPQSVDPGVGGAGGAGGEVDNWFVDTTNDPPLVRLQGALCDRVEQGVERVDVVLGCPPVF